MADDSLIHTLYTSGKLNEHVFAMCLSFDGGVFSLGGYDSRLHLSTLQWTPLTSSRNFYTVHVSSVTIDGHSIAGVSALNR